MTNGNSEASREVKRLAAVLLDVLAGARTPPQAAEVLGASLPRYDQLEDRSVAGLTRACEARPRGRQADAQTELHALKKENDRLRKELGRYQSLVRLTQRTVGVPPAPPAKATGKRKRKPMVRAMRRAARLRSEAEEQAGAEPVRDDDERRRQQLEEGGRRDDH
jgi:hypothetical protein